MAMLIPEFLQLLLEPVCVFWRKVPMCTQQYYFGKLEMATVVFKTGQKHLHHIRTPKKATFVSSEPMQVCFKSPKTKSDKWHCIQAPYKISCSKVLSNMSGIVALLLTTDIINNCTASHDKWAWSTVKPYELILVDLCRPELFDTSCAKIQHQKNDTRNKLSQALIYLSKDPH